jgi:hypothetical protein
MAQQEQIRPKSGVPTGDPRDIVEVIALQKFMIYRTRPSSFVMGSEYSVTALTPQSITIHRTGRDTAYELPRATVAIVWRVQP